MTSGAKPTFIPGAVPGAHRSDAVEQSSSIPHLLSSAILHQQNGRLTEASQIYRQILAIDPHHADSLHLLGVVECQSGHLEVAANLIRSAIAIHRTSAFYYSNLGIVLHAQGNLEEAAIRYRQALVLKPGMAEVHLNLGNILKVQNKPEESIACYQQAIVCNPTLAEAFNNLGTIYQSQDRLDEAVASYQHALTLSPDYAKPHNNLGAIHQSQNQLEEAVACYQRAIALDPAYAQAFYNLGRVLTAQGHLDDALLQYKTALTLDPTYGQAAFSESLTQLLQADFAVGWPNFENRWRSIDHKTPMRPYPQPLWTGHALSSGRLLLWGEQGVGDEILFASLIPDLLRNRIPCLLDCDRRLQPLFARSFPSIEVIAAPDLEAAPIADSEAGSAVAPAPDITFHLPTGSLPHLLRPNLVSFSNTTSPYLFADPIHRDHLRSEYANGSLIVGLAWQTNNQNTGRNRSMDLSLFAPLFTLPGIRWISLQYGDQQQLEAQAVAAKAPMVFDVAIDQLTSIDDFAAQVAAMDLVITIDNSTAHLAGALGIPTWVLLPFAPDWRWFTQRADSPWYPTLRLFRQPIPGDWQAVIHEVTIALSRIGQT